MKLIWCWLSLLSLLCSSYAQQSPTEEGYESGGFSNFWDEPAGTTHRLGALSKAEHPAQVQGAILTYLRDNPAGFLALIPHIRDMQTWAAAGAFANTILEESVRREQDTQEVEKLLVQHVNKSLVGAVISPILRHSVDAPKSGVNIILASPDTVQILNAMVLLISWEELRPLISSAVQQTPSDQKSDLTARIQAWYHQ